MGETSIEWTDFTFNPWHGCTRVSPGCEHCYAERQGKRHGTQWGVTAERRFFGDHHWRDPVKWNDKAAREGVRRRVFCASMADVFEDRPELEEHRQRLWALIQRTPHLDWLLLTKRPQNLKAMLPWEDINDQRDPWPNVWLGTTVEDQKRANDRLADLVDARARVHFLSCEPLLERVDLGSLYKIDWVIVGGESGPGARPFNVDWARSIIYQCIGHGVAVFVKQLGENAVITAGDGLVRSIRRGESRKHGNPADWPEDLRVRQFPC